DPLDAAVAEHEQADARVPTPETRVGVRVGREVLLPGYGHNRVVDTRRDCVFHVGVDRLAGRRVARHAAVRRAERGDAREPAEIVGVIAVVDAAILVLAPLRTQ